MVAYQPGNAANIAPGDDEPDLVAVPQRADRVERHPALVARAADHACSIPTPKSKPSSTKNPVHKSATRMNQRRQAHDASPQSAQSRGRAFGACRLTPANVSSGAGAVPGGCSGP